MRKRTLFYFCVPDLLQVNAEAAIYAKLKAELAGKVAQAVTDAQDREDTLDEVQALDAQAEAAHNQATMTLKHAEARTSLIHAFSLSVCLSAHPSACPSMRLSI